MPNLTPEEFLKKLSENYKKDRWDISETIDSFLKDGEDTIEKIFDDRYVSGKIPGSSEITVEYDTFTGELSYRKHLEEWKDCEDYETRADE